MSVTSQWAFGFITPQLLSPCLPWTHLPGANTFSLCLCLGRAGGGKAGQEQLHHKGRFVPGQCNTRSHDPIDYILFKRQGYCQVPGPEGSLWYLNLGLADVPALPTWREKDFTRLLIQLLAADFQVRFCPANCVWHCKYSGVMKKFSSVFQHLMSARNLLHQVLTSVLLQKTLENVDLGDPACTLRLLTLVILTFCVSCVPGHPPAPSLTHSECRNTPLLGVNGQ